MKTVLVTGAGGFIGKHLCSRLAKSSDITLLTFTRQNKNDELEDLLKRADIVFHLASVMRPDDISEFDTVNVDLTQRIIDQLHKSDNKPLLVFTSSVQVALDNPYAHSKSSAEKSIMSYANATGNPCVIYRLPNIFGPDARPNYTSVVATFCNNIAKGIPIDIHNPEKEIYLGYIDSVIDSFIDIIDKYPSLEGVSFESIATHPISLKELAEKIYTFKRTDRTRIESGFDKELYKTYLSYT